MRMTDVQREVAVHLLANAFRRLRARESELPSRTDDGDESANRGQLMSPRNAGDEMYLRGMLDMLRALYGPAAADELHRLARAFERSVSTR